MTLVEAINALENARLEFETARVKYESAKANAESVFVTLGFVRAERIPSPSAKQVVKSSETKKSKAISGIIDLIPGCKFHYLQFCEKSQMHGDVIKPLVVAGFIEKIGPGSYIRTDKQPNQ